SSSTVFHPGSRIRDAVRGTRHAVRVALTRGSMQRREAVDDGELDQARHVANAELLEHAGAIGLHRAHRQRDGLGDLRHALARSARTMWNESECTESMRTRAFGSRSRMIRVASMPFRSGMLLSIRTTSGCSSVVWRTASRPLLTVATTSMSG